ncbi:hypothetical protein NHQ30_010889 [Ciborinia camelliae]|nr:hypothetical protein NHQ30_010889 [Ciborinia camelliae]
MLTLLPSNYVSKPTSSSDLAIASIAFGWTLGFGWLTIWKAYKQTRRVEQRYGITRIHTPYVVMIWAEILVCMVFAFICWLHFFAFFFCILTLWALQVQFLLQIIVNRISILFAAKRRAVHLKIFVAVLITLVNISVYCIWIPARLQISERYIWLNDIWDRCEKAIYLLVDAMLNYYFMRTVHRQLVGNGMQKYKALIKFNAVLVAFSLSMDVLIIGMMSLDNSFVYVIFHSRILLPSITYSPSTKIIDTSSRYMQFHPLAYLVKLNIEMSMAELIAKIAVLPSNVLPPKHHIALKIGIQTDISIKRDKMLETEMLELEERISSPAPTISKEFGHGRLVFGGADYEDGRGITEARGKGRSWLNS